MNECVKAVIFTIIDKCKKGEDRLLFVIMKFIRKQCVSQQYKGEWRMNWPAAFGIINNRICLNKWNSVIISNSYDSVYVRV